MIDSVTAASTSSLIASALGSGGSSTAGLGGIPVSNPLSSPDYVLAGNLGSQSSSAAPDFLSNALFAEDTIKLLNDPHENGAIGGTATRYVQEILKALDPGISVSVAPPPAGGLAPGGSTDVVG